ncbi:transcription factor E2F3-like [Sarcoptes scabiei]|nr:transcription factor E2F3-like [Sarcoptes scabiei]
MNRLNAKYEYAVPLDAITPISEDEFRRLVPNPVKRFPFELDTFQKQAIIHIANENVFVAAHTSAGKTVVAEYGIALAFSHKTRVIYTSPIKALSNQKFRDLKMEFNDVGIITGDVQLNPEAQCLVMTTEILLQMLYASSETINHLEYVIFDECHYVNDSKRGHVWEEVFILLPSSVKLILLSATVPNVIEFSDWLGRTRRKKIYVICTEKRPVPLKHYLYLGRDGRTQNQQILILEGDGEINKQNYSQTAEIMNERKGKFGFIKRSMQNERNVYLNLIRHLQKNDKLPVICFTLSRKKCDRNLEMLLSIKEENSSLTTKRESFLIKRFVYNHLKNLNKSDFELDQVKRVSTMLVRGFGVHHSGILPLLKELTEILFSSGLVKVLFATETFAMGVNMPARTVVFDSLSKHDGNQNRLLKPAEYIQMAGRAGRRGKDVEGTVIILSKYDVPSLVDLNMVMKGSAQVLQSQFRITYHMILNVLKSQTSIESFLKSSYREHNKVLTSNDVANNRQKIRDKIDQLPYLTCEICTEDIDLWYAKLDEFHLLKQKAIPIILGKASDKKLLLPGRSLVFEDREVIFRCGLLIRSIRAGNATKELIVLALNKHNEPEVLAIEISKLICLLTKQIKGIDANAIIQENDFKSKINSFGKKGKFATEEAGEKLRTSEFKIAFEALKIASETFVSYDKLGRLDPDTMFQLQEYGLKLRNLSKNFRCGDCKNFIEHFKTFRVRSEMENDLLNLDYRLSNESLELLPEYKLRIELLKNFNFINDHLVLLPKGQIASCISDCELLITEIVFENLLGNLSDEALPAVLSCFVFDKQSDDDLQTKFIQEIPELDENIKKIVQISMKFGKAEKEYNVEDSENIYLDQLNFETVRSVYEWAKGKSFSVIMQYTNLQEGIMVRCIQRTDELMKNIKIAARNMEMIDFQAKLERSSQLIRRDIVFMPSLYTSKEMATITVDHGDADSVIEHSDGQAKKEDENEDGEDQKESKLFFSNDFFNYSFENLDEDQDNIEVLSEERFNYNFY